MIIGLTGTHGAGKGTVVDYLVNQKGFKSYSVSDVFLKNESVRRGLEPDRPNRTMIANEYRALGPTKLMEATLAEAQADIDSNQNVIIEPQYTADEVEFIKEQGGIEIAIDADLPVRYERITKRGSAKDNISYEAFVAAQTAQLISTDPQKQNLLAAIEHADYHILNNGSVKDLYQEIDTLLAKLADKHN